MRPKEHWTLDIDPGYTSGFQPGPARAIGIICGMGDEDVRVFFWSQEVELEEA
jgi:hypothetical protein